uniref:Pescadillo homolog n=1 Tax=Arcella intermedia TaxID=1963864 RepID=A0A6B2L0A1_9EUKA
MQISLPEFRKLCILKGIYPREPKKAPAGKEKTYYLRKDIIFLQHEPIITRLHERRIWKRKVKKAKDKKQASRVEYLKKHKPSYTLNHIVRERYPTFVDALRDLDDALCMVFLFAVMPASDKIIPARVATCRKLALEFEYYIIKTHSLRKVFLSIKGVYHQAEVQGQTITWLVPYKFSHTIRKDVDYKVMLSFLEFYEILLGFVNFKLYYQLGLPYPPKFTQNKFNAGDELEALEENKAAVTNLVTSTPTAVQEKPDAKKIAESKERISTLSQALKNVKESESSDDDSLEIVSGSDDEGGDAEEKNDQKMKDAEEEEDEEDEEGAKKPNANDEDAFFADDEMMKMRKQQEVYENLFEKCHFWLSRETPKDSIEFIIKCFGGKLSWEGNGTHDDPTITHEVVDRPKILGDKIISREYIQPQWVYDSINTKILLPAADYAPGAQLPPHLSPFVDDNAEGYVPEYRKKLEQLYKEKHGIALEEVLAKEEPSDESESDEERFAEDLAAEKQGTYSANQQKQNKKSKASHKLEVIKKEEKEQQETAVSLLSQRNRKIIQKMKMKKERKQKNVNRLEEKKAKLEKGLAKIENSTIVYQTEV